MYKGKRILGVIPARGGSKGLPGKNILELCGKPLISWSIEAGLESALLSTLVVSTEDESIARIAMSWGAWVPFLRPPELATDTATSFDTVLHALNFCERETNVTYDYVLLIEPTSPLREQSDIDGIIKKLIDQSEQYDSIVTLGNVREHPALMKITSGDDLRPYDAGKEKMSRRQDLEKVYFPYGVGYMAKTDAFRAEKTFYSSRCTYFLIKSYQCLEIDDLTDFLCVEAVMKKILKGEECDF